MEHSGLTDLITALEYGNNFHIAVNLFDRCGNVKTRLPLEQRTHETPVCEAVKGDSERYCRCYRCQEVVLRMVTTRKKSCDGLCINGVYEYCRPLIRDEQVVGVILIGNIYDGSPEQLRRLAQKDLLALVPTMQHGFTRQDCERTADILESYISYLLDTYGERTPKTFDTLVEDIRSYIEENAHSNFSTEALATHFNYNEKYLGRLFKSRTGYTIREYCNQVRLSKAKKLLKSTKLSISRIATQAGYNNVTYFNRVFKEHTRMSPLQYRQKKKAASSKIKKSKPPAKEILTSYMITLCHLPEMHQRVHVLLSYSYAVILRRPQVDEGSPSMKGILRRYALQNNRGSQQNSSMKARSSSRSIWILGNASSLAFSSSASRMKASALSPANLRSASRPLLN